MPPRKKAADKKANSQGQAKAIISQLPEGLQLRTTQELNKALQEAQTQAAATLVQGALEQLLALDPPLTLQDGNDLLGWQEGSSSGRTVTGTS
jgi:outer membrane PBP1 activator LpoA protein